MLNCIMKREKLILLIKKQLNNFFFEESYELIDENIDEALLKIEECFSVSKNQYFNNGQVSCFSPYHTVQYSIFLYYLSNIIGTKNHIGEVATQIYYLNKIMNGVDWYHEIELPDHFLAEHPIGSVLGRAIYGDNLFIYQGSTVGGNKGKYPVIGKNVVLCSDAKIIGDCNVGDNVIVSANTYIKDIDIPNNCIVFGISPNLIIKEKNKSEILNIQSHLLWGDIS